MSGFLGIFSQLNARLHEVMLAGAPGRDEGLYYKIYEWSEDIEAWRQSKKPDNIPIIILIGLLIFFTYISFKQAFRNDRIIDRLEKNPKLARTHHRKWEPYHKSWPRKLHVWPYLLRIEFVGALFTFAFLMAWSLIFIAPVEEPANPAFTPNPSKAPWYFLGLQELLVYFDPWIAGVILPFAIVLGLMAIPYIDVNKYGNGYYTWKQRRFSITTFLFGFVVLWIGMVYLGTYLRGPGWQLFMPWEPWNAHRVTHEMNLDLNELWSVWTGMSIPNAPKSMPKTMAEWMHPATIFGFVAFMLMFNLILAASWFGFKKWKYDTHMRMSLIQLIVLHTLNAGMIFVVVKMVLRLWLAVKYVWVIPGVLNV